MNFATSCSIDPGFTRGRAVIRETRLKNMLADYHMDNYYPIPEDRAEMQYGAFVQLWSTRYGKGRVVGFTDSTIFSNFCTFDPGKAELMLGMIEWLNHRGANVSYSLALLGLGIFALGRGGWIAAARRYDLSLLVAASVLGWTTSLVAVREIHARGMPVPQPQREFVQVNIDRTICDALLARNGFVDGTANGFGIFERWVLRLGYFTSRREAPSVFEGDLVVFLRPMGKVDESFRTALVTYVKQGGKVLVLDSARDGSTTNDLLKPFQLAIDEGVELDGPLRNDQAWPEVPVQHAAMVSGGQPFAWIDDQPVGTTKAFGKGSVTLLGIADRFCDAQMGYTGDVIPDESLRSVYELEFQLLRRIIDGVERN
jgi:hypothetical protein